MTRSLRAFRLMLSSALLVAAVGALLLGAAPARAQAITQSNLEGRVDKIRQGQRNARIAVDVLVAKYLLTPPDFPNFPDDKWSNAKGKKFDPPANGLGNGKGGFLPASLGVARTDEFDAPLGYCARGKGGINAKSPIVYAVIWPGLDGVFQTNCADVLQHPGKVRDSGLRESGANGDDYVAFASLNYILGNAVTKVLSVPDDDALLAIDTDEVAVGELRFVDDTTRLWRWNGTIWEDASGLADLDGDGDPDSLKLKSLTLTGKNGPLRAAPNGLVVNFAFLPDATDTLVVTNGDGKTPGVNDVSIGLKKVPQSAPATVDGSVIPVPLIDDFGRVTGFDNSVNLQTAVGSFSWALGGNLNTVSGANSDAGNIGQAPVLNSNFLGTTDAQDLRLVTNGKVRAILDKDGTLSTGGLNVTGPLISTGSATVGTILGGSLEVRGPQGQTTPLLRIQNFVGETLTEQVTISSNGTVQLKSLGGSAGTSLSGLDRVVVSADTGLLSQVSTSALLAANAWMLGGNTGTNPATNFIGTTDPQDFVIRTANVERARVLGAGSNAGFVGIGDFSATAPTARLDVAGTFRARGDGIIDGALTVTNLLTANGGVVTPSVSTANTLALSATGGSGMLTISTAGSERLRVTSTGRVGIGTASPDRTLDVVGTFRASNNAEIGGTLTVAGATALNSTLAVSNAATFGNAVTIAGLLRANGGTETTFLTASGNAGIGGNLNVTGTSLLTGAVTANGGITTTTLAATTSVTTPLLTNAGTLTLSATGTSGTILANTNGTERLRITSGGRVGINTGATVDAALQVNSGADATVGLIVRGNSATQSVDLFRAVRGNGTNVVSIDQRGNLTLLPFGTAAGNTNELRFAGVSGGNYVGFRAPSVIGASVMWTLPSVDGADGSVLATNGGGGLRWIDPLTASSGWTLVGNNFTTSGGNLGAAPVDNTNFLGTVDNVDLRIVTNNRVRAIITAGGQFQTNDVAIGGGTVNGTAIGNTNPSTGGFTTVTANTRVTTPLVTGSALQLASSAGTLALQATGGPITATTTGVERLRITTGGNVGINQANPTTLLDVNGTFNAALAATFGNTVTVAGTTSAAKFIPTGGTAAGNGMFLPAANTLAFSTANTERLRIDANGLVGIGMVPVRTLDITGSFGVTGAADVGGALTVGGATALNNTLTVAGASAINNTLGVTGLLTANGGISTTNLTATGTGSFGGALGVGGATTLSDTLTVGGATRVNNTLRVTGATALDSALTVGGATQVNNTLGVLNLLTASGGISTTNLTATGNGSFGGTLGVTGSTTLSSLGGAARTDLTGLDRVVMSDSTGLLSQVSTATLVGATAWALTGNTGTNPTNNFLGTRDAADLAIRTNNADRIRILGTGANAGFVGINTTAPTAMLDVNGSFRATGLGTFTNGVTVSGTTTLNNALSVGGITTLTGALNANGGIVTTNLTANGNGSFSGTLSVTGVSTLGTLSAGNTTISGTLGVNGATTLNNGLTVASGATSVGALTASGAVTLTAGTPNGVAFLNGSRVLTTGSALTFDGTNLATTGNASAAKFIPTGGTAAGNGMYLPVADTLAFSTAGAERLRIASGGNVGIGNNNPSNLLDVGGSFRATGPANFSSSVTVATGGFTSLGGTLTVSGLTTLNNGLTVSAGNTSVGTLTASGAVTLTAGTANGVAFLNGSNVLTTGSALTFDGTNLAVTGLGTASAAKFIPTGGTAAGNGMYLPAADTLAFSTAGTERLRIDPTGRVGIGSGTAGRTLDVFGTLGATGNTVLGAGLRVNGATELNTTLIVTGVTTLSNLGGTASTAIPPGLDRIVMANNTGVLSQVSTSALVTANAWTLSGNPITSSGSALDGAPTGSYLGTTSDQNLQLVTNGVVRAVITNAGQFRTNNVALGGGTINNTSIGATTANTGRFTTLDATGNATVAGTTTLTGLLTANGGVRTPTVNGTSTLALTADAGTLSLAAGGANIITASTNGTERMRITSTGLVGIGTTLPVDTLTVGGTFRATNNSNIGGTLGVLGATSLGSSLGVNGATTLDSTLTVAGASRVNNTLRVTGLLTADTGVRTPIVSSDGDLALSALNADPITFSTNGAERMRVDASGRIGIGTNNPTSAQVMIQNQSPTLPGLLVRGNLLQTGRIIDIQSGSGTTYFSIAPNGETRVARRFVTEDETAFQSIAGGSPATLMEDNDRIVVANPQGRIAQVSPGAFVDQYAWGLVGNALPLSDGGLGDFPIGSFLGTTNARDLRLVTNNTVRAILNSADGRFDVASLRAGEVSSAANLILRGGGTVEGLRVTTTGRVGVGANVTPDAQLQVNTGIGTTRGLVVNGLSGQTANLFEARVNNANRFSIDAAGLVSAAALQVADVGTGVPNTVTPLGYDRVVVANSDGRLSQIAFTQLSNEATWLLGGNTGITSGGGLGSTVSGRFFGMRDSQPIRFVTEDRVRAILTAGGQFQTNDVAIGGGTINATAIGNSNPSTGVFTTLRGTAVTATASLTTPVVQSGGALSVTANDGGLALAAGGTTNDITFSTSGAQRMLLTSDGRLGLGTTVPGAQLQVNNTSAGTKVLVVNGVAGQTANLVEAQVGGSSRFTVTQTGAVTASGGLTAQSLRATALGDGSPNTSTPSGYDRVVIAQSGTGQLSQIAFSQLTNDNTWLITGNAGGTSAGDLGSAPLAGSRFLGTRDNVDLRFATNDRVRAIITADGEFQTNDVAIGGGTIDATAIGGTTRASGAFTTLVADTTVAAGTNVTAGTSVTAGVSVITPLVTNTGNLSIDAVNGRLSLATTGAFGVNKSIDISAAGNNAITLRTNNNERLRIEGATGFVGINTATPGAQLQVNAPVDSAIGLIVRSQPAAVGDVLAARVGESDVFRVRPSQAVFNIPLTVNGDTAISSTLSVTGATRLSALGGTAGALSGDRVVVANSTGDLSQVARSTLVTSEAWGLSGNANIGAGNFIGTTDENDLRFRTNNQTRATITWGGVFQIGNVGITGGSINGTAIGNNVASTGNFTTVWAPTINAGAVVNTPTLQRAGGGLTVATVAAGETPAGNLTLSAGASSSIRFLTTDLGTERMRLTTDGRLGLGVTVPDKTLDIAGDFAATGPGTFGGGLGVGGRLTVAGANDTAVNGLTVNGTSLSKIASLGGTRNTVVLSGFDRVVLANAAGELQQFDLSKFDLVGGGGGGGGGAGSSVAVDDEGNQLTLSLGRLNFVGLGVTASATGNDVTVSIPGVNGTLTRDPEFDTVRVSQWVRTPRLESSGSLAIEAGGAERLSITSTGNVGIGTTSPVARLQVSTGAGQVEEDTVALRVTGANVGGTTANLFEVGTTAAPTTFRIDRFGNTATSGGLTVGNTVTLSALGGGAGSGMAGNDRVIIANGAGRLAQVSPAAFVSATGWSLLGNSLPETGVTPGDTPAPVLGATPVGSFLGATSATDLQLVTSNRVRAIITAAGVLQSDNAVLTGGRIDGMPIGGTTRAAGAFTTVIAGTSVTTPRLLNPGDITITAGVADPPPGQIAGNLAMTAVSGSMSFATVGTDPLGISFAAAGDNKITFSTNGQPRMVITGGQFGPIGIGTTTPDALSMLQITTSGDATKGLVIVGTPNSDADLLRVGLTGDPTLNTVLAARRDGVAVTSLVAGATALSVNGRAQITGALQASESVTFNTLAGTPSATLGVNNRVVVADNTGVLSQVSPEGLVADYAWALTGNNVASSGGLLGAAPTGKYLGTSSNVDLRLVTGGLVRAIVTREGQFQTNNALITGGAINSTPIGSGGRSSGAFTSLSATEVIGAPGVSGGNLALTASSGNLGITASSGRVTLTARGAANPIVFATRPVDDDVPRLTITPDGQIGVGTGVPTAQLQVESADDSVVGLAVNGTASATGAALLTVDRGATSVLSVGRTASTLGTTLTVSGTTSVPALNASGAVTFASLAGGVGADDADYDRVVVANSSGRLRQIGRNTLVTNSAWGLSGNANTGPTNFLGTTDDADLRFGTKGAIRATLTSAGVFQIDNVAIASGAINGTTIGLTAPASARFTTVQADTSVTTPTLRNGGDLAVTTTAGNLSLNAGGLSRITAATNGTERLRIDQDGRIFIGDRDLNGPALIDPANDSLPQLQVNSAAAVSPALVARGYPGQVANLLEVQGYDLATSSFQRELTVNAAGIVNLRSLGGATNPVVTVGDRLVVANAQGRLMQVDTVKLITSTTWGLTGNAVITQPGTLGSAPTGNFLGTTDARDIGFVTNNRIRAMIDSGGTFRTAGNLVANGVTVGRGLDAMPGNTAVGTGALADNNGGDENSAFGTDALRLNTLGRRNTALGVRAMRDNFVGLNNTAVGVDALRSSFSGNGNVALGFEAGFSETGDNRLYIANSRDNNLIYGDFSTGRVLVNAGSTPPATLGAALQVNTVNAGDVGFIVRGASGQTANLFEARNNGGTAVARINNAGNANFNGTLGVNGATTLSSTLNVSSATALGNTLTVANTTTLNGATQINNTLTVTGVTAVGSDLSVGGNGTVAGTLDVTGATRLRSTVLVDGATTIDDTLNVTGNTTVGGTLGVTSTATASKFVPTGNVTAGNGMYLPAANEVAFSTNGAERLRLDNNGNVGVGTDDPQFRLDVTGSFRATTNATVGGTLGVTGATTLGDTLTVTGTTTSSKFIPTGGTAVGNGMYLPAANNLAFSTNGGERLRIDANGLVGIGAGTAARTLDVFGTFGATGAANLNSTLNVGAATTLGGTLGVSGATTLSALGGATPTAAMGGNDRIVVTNSSGLLSNVSVAGLVTANAWGLSGNAIGASGDGNSNLNGAPVGSYLGSTSSQPLQFIAGNVVRAIIDDSGEFRIQNIDVRNGAINNTSIGATTANTGRFTSLAATGNATVDGTTTLTGLLTANGGVTTSTVTTTGAATIGGQLNANGGISTTSVTASGNGVFTGTLRATGGLENTAIGVTTANTGRFTTLDTTGAATVAGLLSANGGVTTTTLTTSGAVTLNGGTVNGVAYLNGSRQLATGPALTFDGTNLATTGSVSAIKFSLITGGNNGGNGMYMPAGNILAFSTNGGERLRIDTSGDVGIGTNAPIAKLDVNGTLRAGATTLTGLLTASGGVTTSTVTTTGAATIGGALNANGGISTTAITASSDGAFTGTLRATGGLENTAIGATTANTGRFTTLETTGAATLAGLLNANGGVSTTTLNALGTGTIGGLLTASGGIATTSVTASGNGAFTGTLRATGGIENTAIGVTTANTGRFTTLESTGAATLAGLLSANGGVTTTTLNASGTGTIGGLLTASNGISTTAITASSDGTFTGVLRAAGGIENTAIGTITANTGRFTGLTATGVTTLTGLLTANGGIGTTTVTTSGNAIVGGTLRVDNATNLVGNLTVNGVTTLVNSLSADGGVTTPTLAVTGGASVGGLLAANGGVNTTAVRASGDLTLQPATGASVTNALRFTDLSGANAVGFRAPTALTGTRIWTLPGTDGDPGNVLATDGSGILQWISPLTASSGWALNGNSGGSSAGALGSAPTAGSRFLGTRDNSDLRLVTNNLVRAIITTAGQFQTNNVAIGGGTITNATINNTAIGAGGASTGAFTTLDAASIATTGGATIGGGLTVAGAASVDGLLEAKGGISTNSITASTTLTVTGVTTLNGAVTANDGLKVVDGLITDTITADGGSLSAMTISGGTINNAVIGATTAAAGTFTDLAGSTKLTTPKVTNAGGTLALDADTLALNAKDLALAATGGTSYLTISTGGDERLRVDGFGNVGIGTNAPTARLDVNGKVRARSDLAVDGKLDVTGQTTMNGALNAIGGITTTSLSVSSSVSTGTLTASTSVTAPALVSSSLSSTGALALVAGGSTNSVAIIANGATRVTIGADGLVDIAGSFRAGGAATFDSTVTISGGTVNGIPYLNADKQLVTGDKLTFDGTTLNVKGMVSAAKFIPTGGLVAGNGMYLPATDTLAFSTNGGERLRIGSDGRIGIGTGADIGAQLQINGATNTTGLIVRGGAGAGKLLELQDSGGGRVLEVTADGSMGIGKAPGTGFKLDVEGDIRGTRVFAQGVELTSDARFKTNIAAIADALSIVRKLQGVSYDWNRAAFPDRGFSPRPQIGVLAQEVEKVLPELVSTDAQGYKSVNYTGFIPVLIEGMKQQADRLDEQGARLVTAEQTLAMVEERLFKTEEQVLKIDERLGQAEAFVARFSLTREPDTMVVLTPTFKVQNLTADRAYIAELRAQRIEAEKARFVELDADGATIDSVDAARLRGRVVNTGGKELFVSLGTVAPLFEAAQDAHYIVSVTAEDGSFATAQVVNAGGMVRVVPTASQGIDVVANGKSVGLLAPSKKVKASWTRTG